MTATEQVATPASVIDHSPRSATSFIVPFVGSIFQTCGIVWMACDTPTTGKLLLPHLFITAAHFLLIAAAAHIFAVWINAEMFSGLVDASSTLLILTLWPSIVWAPLFILLIKENSVWTILIPPIIFASATRSLRRWTATSDAAPPNQSQPVSTLFQAQHTQSFLRSIGPAIIAAAAFQAALAELALTNYFYSSLLLATGTAILVWSYPFRVHPIPDRAMDLSFRKLIRRTILVFLLLAIALIPYLVSPTLARDANTFIQTKHKPTQSKSAQKADDDSYLGIILLPPRKPHHRIVIQPATITPSGAPKQPVVIPFDGAYWYFKPPDQSPRPGAVIARGDPTKKTIRSTNTLPLLMEAHQSLGLPIQMNSFSAIRLSIKSADHIPGAIYIDIRLRNISPKGIQSQSLGAQLLPSTTHPITYASLIAQPTDELLTFHIPHSTRLHQFNEITVAIEPAKTRNLVGARVAVQSFELLP